MSRLKDMLDKSRLAGVIDQVERGEPVDYPRVLALQALDVARAGQIAVVEALDREDEADERFKQQLEQLQTVASGG